MNEFLEYFVGHNAIQYIMTTFFILLIYSLVLHKYKNNFLYIEENEIFKNFPNNNLKAKSKTDYLTMFLLIMFLLAFAWNLLSNSESKHNDSLLMIAGISCSGEIIEIWSNIWGRFMPLAHQEFNFLGGIFRKLNCSYSFLYSLAFSQLLLVIFFLNKILPFPKLSQRLFAIILIITEISFFRPFSHLIINDRNSIFLSILFIYFVINFYKNKSYKSLICSLICVNLALYYKESMFLFFSGFACCSLLIKIIREKNNFTIKTIYPLSLIKKYPLEMGLLILTFLFLVGFFFNVYLTENPDDYYIISTMQNNYLQYFIISIMLYYIILLTFIATILYIKNFNNIKNKIFIFSLFSGGILYLLLIFYLQLGYRYYSVASTSIIISFCYYLKETRNISSLKYILVSIIIYYSFCNYLLVHESISKDKKIQISHSSIKEYLNSNERTNLKIFYYQGNNFYNIQHSSYQTQNFFLLIKSIIKNKNSFTLCSFNGCYSEDYIVKSLYYGCTNCSKVTKLIIEDYDLTFFFRNRMSKEEWNNIFTKYGTKIKKITSFPKAMGMREKHNIYVYNKDNSSIN